jgi:hypothetical protein
MVHEKMMKTGLKTIPPRGGNTRYIVIGFKPPAR